MNTGMKTGMKIRITISSIFSVFILGLGLCVGALFLSSCARYKAQPLNRLSTEHVMPVKNAAHKKCVICTAHCTSPEKCEKCAIPEVCAKPVNSSQDESVIVFAHHVLNKGECKTYLDRDVLKKGFQPVHITLVNNTARYINFAKSNMSIPCVSASEVAQKVHTSTVARATGYGAAAFFLFLPLAIPAVVDGFGSSQANKKLNADFFRKELPDQLISPYCSINGLIFVREQDYKPDFAITLVDGGNHERFTLTTCKPSLAIADPGEILDVVA